MSLNHKFFFRVILSIFLLFFDIKATNIENTSKSEVLHVSIYGLVCDFCARSIEKMLSKKESVDKISVSLENMLVTIRTKQGMNLNDLEVQEVITNSGYEVKEILRVK